MTSFESNMRKSGPISKWGNRNIACKEISLQKGQERGVGLLFSNNNTNENNQDDNNDIQLVVDDADDKSCMIIGPCKGKKAKQRGQRGRTSPRDSNMSARFVSNKFCPALTENCC